MIPCQGAVVTVYDFGIHYYNFFSNCFCLWVQRGSSTAKQIIMGRLLFGTRVKTFYTRNWSPHHTIEAGLVVKLYACSKIKVAGGRGIPNSVTPQRKIDKFSKTMLKITEPKTKNSACLVMPQYQNSRPQLHKYRMKIWQIPQYCKISQCKELKI